MVAGIDLDFGGRYDIHMMVSPPYPDDLALSERLLKGPRNTEWVVISINPAGLQMGDARINQEGYVLQHTPIDWRHLDYALRLLPVHGGYDVGFLMINADFGQPEIIEGTGCHTSEWSRIVSRMPAWVRYCQGKPPVLSEREAYAQVSTCEAWA